MSVVETFMMTQNPFVWMFGIVLVMLVIIFISILWAEYDWGKRLKRGVRKGVRFIDKHFWVLLLLYAGYGHSVEVVIVVATLMLRSEMRNVI